MFIKTFAAEAYKYSDKKDMNLDYFKLASLASKEEKFGFLEGNIFG
jgi:hypothetical protein